MSNYLNVENVEKGNRKTEEYLKSGIVTLQISFSDHNLAYSDKMALSFNSLDTGVALTQEPVN